MYHHCDVVMHGHRQRLLLIIIVMVSVESRETPNLYIASQQRKVLLIRQVNHHSSSDTGDTRSTTTTTTMKHITPFTRILSQVVTRVKRNKRSSSVRSQAVVDEAVIASSVIAASVSSSIDHSSTDGLTRSQRSHARRHAMTQGEFDLCVLTHLIHNKNKNNNNTQLKEPQPQPQQSESKRKTRIRKRETSTNGRSPRSTIFSFRCTGESGHSLRSVSPLSVEDPLPPLMPHMNKHVKRVSFSSRLISTSTHMLNIGSSSNDKVVAQSRHEADQGPRLESLEDDPRRINSIEDVCQSLKRERRRSHNMALTGEEFEANIIPNLLTGGDIEAIVIPDLLFVSSGESQGR